jgi:two-component system, NtrC family, nitrogen regulation sensor histidine kinase NtrY
VGEWIGSRQPMKIPFQNELALIALAGGLPATLIAVIWSWSNAPTFELRLVACGLLIFIWVVAALSVRHRLAFPLQSLANLIEAVRFGDYGLRGRRAARDDALGEVVKEINALGSALQQQRLASMEASALVQTVLEELDTAVLAFDAAQRLALANRAAAELMGRTADSLQGRTARELGVAELLGRTEPTVMAYRFPARTGRFEIRQRTVREAGLPHTLLIVSDLSRTLREEERRAWQRLIRVIGHEINNSLTPIKSLAGTLRQMLASRHAAAAPAGDEIAEGLSLIGDRAGSLSKFVATYSQLARLPPPSRQPVELRALLQRLASLEPFGGIPVDAPHEVTVQADAGQLEQAIINLLKNASEATTGGRGAVRLVLSRTRGSVVIEVRDEGPGVANTDNLFVPFFTTKPGGSGIGLTLSRQIVEGHGGTLSLENRADRSGCIARITLPLGMAVGPDGGRH